MFKRTPKEEAIDIYSKMTGFRKDYYLDKENDTLKKAKTSSLNLVDCIISEIPLINNTNEEITRRTYYIEVKQELKKL